MGETNPATKELLYRSADHSTTPTQKYMKPTLETLSLHRRHGQQQAKQQMDQLLPQE
jgi:hypothetical protein